jgi:hypothetical protein
MVTIEFISSLLTIGLPALVIVVVYLYSGRPVRKEPPLPAIDQLDELVADYLIEHHHGFSISQKALSNYDEHMEWQLEFNKVLNEAETAMFMKQYSKEIYPEYTYDHIVPESEILSVIRALTNRLGYDHPKTQKVVKWHQDRMSRWNR